ncbi:MAG: hypothetical protein WCV63_00440 [Negativicutes bacterium]
MIKINLIPERQRIRSSPINRILLALSLIILIACIGGYIDLTYNDMAKKSQIANTEAIYGILSQSKEKINMLNKYKQFKDAKSGQLIKFTEQRVPWYALLSELSIVVPRQVKILTLNGGGQIVQTNTAKAGDGKDKPATDSKGGIKQQNDDKQSAQPPVQKVVAVNDNGTHIIMTCEAESYAVVAQFVDILNNSKRFTKPIISGLTSNSKADEKANIKNNKVKFSVDITANFK